MVKAKYWASALLEAFVAQFDDQPFADAVLAFDGASGVEFEFERCGDGFNDGARKRLRQVAPGGLIEINTDKRVEVGVARLDRSIDVDDKGGLFGVLKEPGRIEPSPFFMWLKRPRV